MTNKTFIEEYYEKIMSEEIIACNKIKKIYTKIYNDLKNQNGKYIFNEKKANRPIEFIETFCKQSQGEIGKKIELQLFQKAKIQTIFGFINKENGYRRYKEVLDIRGRKNGKTTELAGIELYMQIADGEGAAECYCIATKLDQAKKCFNEIQNMIMQSKELKKLIKKRKTDLYYKPTMSTIQALGSNSNGLDGLNSHIVTIDELSAIKNRDIYDLMKQSMSARRQPLLFCITTNGFIRNGIYDSQYDYACKVIENKVKDESFLPIIYELDSKEEWDKEECWIKANPGIGVIKNKNDLRNFVNKAKNDNSFKPSVLVKDFNLTENSSLAYLKYEDINNEKTFELTGFSYGIAGFDVAETTDLSAAKVLLMKNNDNNIYCISMYWIPRSKINMNNNRQNEDKVPYELWEKQGYLKVTEGNKIDKTDMLKWFIEIREKYNIYVYKFGYDPWHVEDSLLKEYKNYFGEEAMEKVRQGSYTLSPKLKELKEDLKEKIIIYNNNPIDKWCLSNLKVKVDINDNIQPIKIAQRKRIDGAIALLNAYVVLKNNFQEFKNLLY